MPAGSNQWVDRAEKAAADEAESSKCALDQHLPRGMVSFSSFSDVLTAVFGIGISNI